MATQKCCPKFAQALIITRERYHSVGVRLSSQVCFRFLCKQHGEVLRVDLCVCSSPLWTPVDFLRMSIIYTWEFILHFTEAGG